MNCEFSLNDTVEKIGSTHVTEYLFVDFFFLHDAFKSRAVRQTTRSGVITAWMSGTVFKEINKNGIRFGVDQKSFESVCVLVYGKKNPNNNNIFNRGYILLSQKRIISRHYFQNTWELSRVPVQKTRNRSVVSPTLFVFCSRIMSIFGWLTAFIFLIHNVLFILNIEKKLMTAFVSLIKSYKWNYA